MVTYSNVEREIVKAGFSAVQEVIMGEDSEAKDRLLFCLDYYMDPYYGQELSYQEELIRLLEKVIVSENRMSVKEAALGLLIDYTWPPYSILQAQMDKVDEKLLPNVKYAIFRGESE